jgi:hypothetical protein
MGREKIKAWIMVLVFVLPLLLLCFGLSRIHEAIVAPARYRIPAGARILILGDSRADYSLNPVRIGRAVNFSSHGESYIQNYYKFKYAMENAPSLRTVILPVDLHSFNGFRSRRVFFDLEWQRYIDYLELWSFKKQRLYYLREWGALRFFGFRGKYQRFFGRYVQGLRDKPLSQIDRGFRPRKGFFHLDPKKRGSLYMASHQLQGLVKFCPDMVFFFRRILDLARRNDMDVVLLRSPVTPAYMKVARKFLAVNRYYERVREITAGHPRIHFLFKQKMFQRNSTAYFFDAQHMNAKGARIFSDAVRRDLIRLKLLAETDA